MQREEGGAVNADNGVMNADAMIMRWMGVAYVAVSLHMLYKLKTSKLFDVPAPRAANDDDDDCAFAVHRMHLCVDSRLLCVAGSSHVALFNFTKLDASIDCPVSHTASRTNLALVAQFQRDLVQ